MKYLLLMLLLVTGCGPAWHLQKAQKHIDKAKEKGADVASDTTFAKVKFDIVGAKTQFDLGPTIISRQDGTVNKYIIKDTIVYQDRIKTIIKDNKIFVECPDEEMVKEVPVAVDTKLTAGYTKWQYGTGIASGLLFGLVVGFLLGKIIKL
jgi:hypothetical protein